MFDSLTCTPSSFSVMKESITSVLARESSSRDSGRSRVFPIPLMPAKKTLAGI